ncbi:MAG: hypothetical protein ACXW06_06495 [Halobacteriota archaeon]
MGQHKITLYAFEAELDQLFYFVDKDRLSARRGPSINYLGVKTLTTKDQIDDM